MLMNRMPDENTLYFGDDEYFSVLSATEQIALEKKRNTFSSISIVLFYPWISRQSLGINLENNWTELYLRILNENGFPQISKKYMKNFQQIHQSSINEQAFSDLKDAMAFDPKEFGDFFPGDFDLNAVEDVVPILEDSRKEPKKQSAAAIFLKNQKHKFLKPSKSFKKILGHLTDDSFSPPGGREETEETIYRPFSVTLTQTFLWRAENDPNPGTYFSQSRPFKQKVTPPPSKYPSIAEHGARWSLSNEQFVPFSMFCLRLFDRLFKTIPEVNLGPKTKIYKKNLGILFKTDIFFHMLFGGAGCGKSRILLAFFDFVTLWDCSDRIVVTATTGKAATLLSGGEIIGKTWQTAMGLSKNRKNDKCSQRSQRKKWAGVWMLFLDEVSMLGCRDFVRLETRAETLTGLKVPFGGIDFLPSGDFFQLPPVRAKPIFKPWHKFFKDLKMEEGIKKGAAMWFELLEDCSELLENHRSTPAYAGVLRRFRVNNPTIDDIKLINSQVAKTRDALPSAIEKIFPYNFERTQVNDCGFDQAVAKHSQKFGDKIKPWEDYGFLRILLSVKITSHNFDDEKNDKIKKYIRKMGERNLDKCCGVLNLVVGGPATINFNYGVDNGVANGTFCNFSKAILRKNARVSYVRTPAGIVPRVGVDDVDSLIFQHTSEAFENRQTSTELPPGFFRICPSQCKKTFKWNQLKLSVKLKGFRLSPRFALTGHKTQGSTMDHAFIGSFGKHRFGTQGWLYVVLSRVPDICNLFLLEKLSEDLRKYRPRKYVLQEEKRMQTISKVTKKKLLAFFEKINI